MDIKITTKQEAIDLMNEASAMPFIKGFRLIGKTGRDPQNRTLIAGTKEFLDFCIKNRKWLMGDKLLEMIHEGCSDEEIEYVMENNPDSFE